MTLPRLKSLLAAWASEKSLHQLVLRDESFIDHFFRCLEESHGNGHLAAHVAHACIMAFDEYVVSIYSHDSHRQLECVLDRYGYMLAFHADTCCCSNPDVCQPQALLLLEARRLH